MGHLSCSFDLFFSSKKMAIGIGSPRITFAALIRGTGKSVINFSTVDTLIHRHSSRLSYLIEEDVCFWTPCYCP